MADLDEILKKIDNLFNKAEDGHVKKLERINSQKSFGKGHSAVVDKFDLLAKTSKELSELPSRKSDLIKNVLKKAGKGLPLVAVAMASTPEEAFANSLPIQVDEIGIGGKDENIRRAIEEPGVRSLADLRKLSDNI